jgi:hypothetical protein
MKKTFTLTYLKRILSILAFVVAITTQSNAQSLVINEIDYDQPGTDSAEYVELFNAGSTPINLANYRLVLWNGSPTGNVAYDSINLPAQTLNTGGFFVICSASNTVPNCNITLTAATNAIQNGASATATTPSPDAVFIREIATGTIVDVVSYEGDCQAPYLETAGVPAGISDTIVFSVITPNPPNNFLSIGRFPDGQDSNNNSTDVSRMCSTPGAANVNGTTGCLTSSLAEINNEISIQVYPNPSHGVVNIDLTKENLRDVFIHVIDVLGKEVKTVDLGDYNSIYSMDMSNLQRGVYFIKINSKNGAVVRRVQLTK